MIKPDFKKNVLNISSTLADFLGYKNNIDKLENLKNILEKKEYRNIIFIIFDGLGIYDINELTTDNDFYKKHIIDILTSTMPATTTNATTAMLSCKYPSQHLWLAWSLYLEEQKRVVEIYLNRDYYTHENTEKYSPNTDITAYLDKVKAERKLFAVVPSYCKNFSFEKTVNANNIDELFEKLNELSLKKDKKFIYAYCAEPDHTMHDFGVHSKETKNVFEKIQSSLEKFMQKNKDTLVITTADHGHIDIAEYIKIYSDREIMNLVERPLCGEGRFASFKIKNGKFDLFVSLFNKKYKNYFDLISVDTMIDEGIFGTQENREEIKKLFGDFIAVGNESFKSLQFFREQELLKGNHGGGSKEEMQVPLCMFEN